MACDDPRLEVKESEEQEIGTGKGVVAAPQGLRMDLGAGGRDEGALPRVFSGFSSRLQGRSQA